MKKKKKRRTRQDTFRRVLRLICGVAAIGCLGYFAVYCYMSNSSSNGANLLADIKNKDTNVYTPATVHLDPKLDTPDMLEDFKTLYIKNKSIVGWISIDGTAIDYPVMQSKSDEYYLDHNFEQEKDNNGSIFIDSKCSIWPRSQNLILYGHNMKSGKMFGSLSNYKQKKFCDEHPLIKFDTLYEKGTYQVMYAFTEIVHEETEVAFKYYQFIDANSAQEYQSNMDEMAGMSLYDTGVSSYYGDSLITLSTCDYTAGSERFVVVAKKISD